MDTLEKLKAMFSRAGTGTIPWKGIVAALAALGIVSSTNPREVLISVLGVFLVTGINALAQVRGVNIGRAWLTVILYGVSLVLAVLLEPLALPALPVWAGDVARFVTDLAVFLQGSAPLVGMVTASATLIYNALKTAVFDKLLPTQGVQ
jgi:hypothetical protein